MPTNFTKANSNEPVNGANTSDASVFVPRFLLICNVTGLASDPRISNRRERADLHAKRSGTGRAPRTTMALSE